MLALVLEEGDPVRLIHPDGTEIVLHGMIRNGKIRLAIDAPRKVSILRDGAKEREPASAVGKPTHFRAGG